MNKVSKRYIRRLFPVALAFALISVLAPVTATAATYTSVKVQPSDPTAGNASVWTFTVSSAAATSAKCLLVYVDTNAAFTSTTPSATFTGGVPGDPGGASLFTAGSWTTHAAQFGSTSAYSYLSSAGMTLATGGPLTFTLPLAANPAVNTYYVKIATFGNTDCVSTPGDSGIGAAAITANTTVSVTVDPTFTFAVNGQAAGTACNGVTQGTGITTTSSAVPFGHLAASGRNYAVQQLQVTTNAGGGYVVYLHSASASSPVLKGSASHTIADVGSNVPVPASGTAFFGYTTDRSSSPITSGNVNPVPNNSGNDVVGNGVAATNSNNCVGYAVGASATTPADTYTSTVVYTAVPTF